jgi:alkylation response protein AidB-like acyl-CoA dehydrogenase
MTAVLQPPVAEQRIAAARALVDDLASRAGQHDREGSFPFESFRRLHETGLLNLTIPTEFGGDGLGLGVTRRVVEQVGRGDASVALELTGNPGLSRRNPLERHYRDVLCSRVHTPQDDSILALAGKAALAAASETNRTG